MRPSESFLPGSQMCCMYVIRVYHLAQTRVHYTWGDSEMLCTLHIHCSFPKFLHVDASSAQEGEIQTLIVHQQATRSDVFVDMKG